MQSTVSLFRHLYEQLPPLFPVDSKMKMRQTLAYLESAPPVALEAIETLMVNVGYEAWPWLEAYQEFYDTAVGQMAEKFLVPKLTPELGRRYEDFVVYGGTFTDLYSGRPAEFFSGEERIDLAAALVETRRELEQFTDNQVVGLWRDKYLSRVVEFSHILAEIRAMVEKLRDLGKRESDHPNLANELKAEIDAFEQGLCFLGPKVAPEKMNRLLDQYQGRRDELNRLRGIELALTFDYAE